MKYKAEPETIGMCAGGVDERSVRAGDEGSSGTGWEELRKRAKHIFVGEKAGWYTLGVDGLELYEKFTDGPKMGGHMAKDGEDA